MTPVSAVTPVAPVRATIPLRLKLVVMACLLAIVPLAVVGLLLIDVNAEAVEELNGEAQILALNDLSRTIGATIEQGEDDLAAIGTLFTTTGLTDDMRVVIIQSEIDGRAGIDHVALYDATGTRILVLQEPTAANVALPDTLSAEDRATLDRAHVLTGEIIPGARSVRVLVAVPIRVEDRVTGYVASAISLEPVQARVERLARDHFGDGADGVFVVGSDFRLIAHPDPELAVSRTEVHDGILAGLAPEMIGPALSIAGEYLEGDGTPMLGTTAAVPGRPWAMVAQVPQSIAYASLIQMRNTVLGVVAAAILLALIFGLALATSISRPLAALTRFAGQLANRELDARVDVRTRDELAVLGGALNRAAGDLAASEAQIRHEVAVRTDLGRYVPEQLVDRIVRREADMRLGGERRPITVMFADVVGFTPLTERLPPEAVVAILNELFTILTQIVFKHGGTVDKFVGDCVMAFWNAPGDQDDHVRRALEAAEDMQGWLESGNERWKTKYGVTIELAIGIHTGEAIVGNVGSEKRMEYTAIGNVVNLAARLEAVARPSQILVTDAVKKAAGDRFEMLDADLHRLTGWAEPVHLWEVRP